MSTCNAISHRPGKHTVADPLSRNPSFRQLHTILAAVTRRRKAASDNTTVHSTTDLTSQPDANISRGTGANATDSAPPDLVSKIVQAYSDDPHFADEKNTRQLIAY